MEDDEETSSKANGLPISDVQGSATGDKSIGTTELTNTERRDFVPEIVHGTDDSQLIGTEPPIVVQDDKPVEREVATCTTGTKMGAESAIAIGEESVPKLHDLQLAGCEPHVAAEYEGTLVAENDTPAVVAQDDRAVGREDATWTSGNEMEAQPAIVTREESVPEMHDSLIAGNESPIAVKDNETDVSENGSPAIIPQDDKAVGLEEATWTPGKEREVEPAIVYASILKLDDSLIACNELPTAVEDNKTDVSENDSPASVVQDDKSVEKEEVTWTPGNKTEAEPAVAIGEQSVAELHDSIAGNEPPIAVKDEEMAEDDSPAIDIKMEHKAEISVNLWEKSGPELHDSLIVPPKLASTVEGDEPAADESCSTGTQMEVEAAMSVGKRSVPELQNSELSSAVLQITTNNPSVVELAAGSSASDFQMETRIEMEGVEAGSAWNLISKSEDLHVISTEPSCFKDNEGDVREVNTSTMDLKTETEMGIGKGTHSGQNDAPELDNFQLPVVDSQIAAEEETVDEHVMEDEISTEEIEPKLKVDVETETFDSGGEEHLSELHDLIPSKDKDHEVSGLELDVVAKAEVEASKSFLENVELAGADSLIASKDDEVNEGDDATAKEMSVHSNMEIEMEVEAWAANGGQEEYVTDLDDSQLVAEDEEDERMVAGGETLTGDAEMEAETDVMELGKIAGGKRKRGRNSKVSANSKVQARAPSRKVVGEDVCFICFDGGELVLCDRRGCSKAYHASCVNRDEAFFRAKGRWNCGWHLCSICEKNAGYMCYTCTFSLCKGCMKDAGILCIRGNKGFCEACMRTVMLIESNEQGNKEAQVDFDDKSSWEFLFKDYYLDLKAKLSLSYAELSQAKNPWKGSDALAGKVDSPVEHVDANDHGGSGSDNSTENLEASKPKRRKYKKRSKSLAKEESSISPAVAVDSENDLIPGNTEWASKSLLEFVMHMKNGDRSVLSQFDVQALLLEYIKSNKLRDPRRKSQIICDARLESLFGKTRVGHFEMLKLIESHFLIKEDSQTDDFQGSVVDNEANPLDGEGNTDALTKGAKDKKRKMRKKGDGRGPQSNLDDYAAIDIHNINLIYLRRKLMEDLLEDPEKFQDKAIGTFVRIRISGSLQKQDLYRLVQVLGTSKAAEPYKVGKRTTDVMLEILNLNKTEVISIDTISNQEFTEDECKRLRQSIKCGLINRLTVGEILDKAMEVQAARVNDWLETEIVRLSHLRDRASEKGRRKELRECVEKLQLLKTPEERHRRLEDVPEVHADPKMDPNYESEEDDSEMDDNRRADMRPGGSAFMRRGRDPISPGGDLSSKDSWSTRKDSTKNWELNRSSSNKYFSKGEDASTIGEILNENSWNQGRDRDREQLNKIEKPGSAASSETAGWNNHSVVQSQSFSGAVLETSPASLPIKIAENATKINESEKIWHYKDPSGKVQGPFSMVQLRKWSNTGYFPADLKIWRTTENEDDSFLLTDALAGRFQKELPAAENKFHKLSTLHGPHHSSTHSGKPCEISLHKITEVQELGRITYDQNHGTHGSNSNVGSGGSWRSEPDVNVSTGWTTPTVEVSKSSIGKWSENDPINLPSPTPKQSTLGWTGGDVGPSTGAASFSGGDRVLQSPDVILQDTQLMPSTTPTSSSNTAQFVRNSENESFRVVTSYGAAPTSEQGIGVGSTNSLLTALPTVTTESHGVRTHSHVLPDSEMASHTVQPDNNLNSHGETHAWAGVSSQNVEMNSSASVPGQPPTHGHWGGITSAVQNPGGNFTNPGNSALPQPQPQFWRPPIPASQSNMQPPTAPNLPWGMNVAENKISATVSRPDNPNVNWGPMQGTPNMGWGGPVPGNMNWGATVQGASPGTANMGWAGNPAAPIQGPVPGIVNPGWGAPAGNIGPVPGSVPGAANPGWVAPTGNMGPATIQGPVPGNSNPNWVPSPGNPAVGVQGPIPGNANPGWGTPPVNQGMWRNEQHNNNGDRFSGRGGPRGGDSGYGGGRPWNRQSSFGGRGPEGGSSGPFVRKRQRACPYYQSGHCKKGAACDYMHT